MDRNSSYCIKAGYRINEVPTFYNDTWEDSNTYQVDVYKHAAQLVDLHGYKSLLDIGCGLGSKLREYIEPLCNDITGIDSEYAINNCRESHEFGNWEVVDLEARALTLERKFDLVMSADVIEHLFDPDNLLRLIKEVTHEGSTVVLSTPERDLRRGEEDMGPPQNTAHIREWNSGEFLSYLETQDFLVNEHRIVDLREGMATCQMVTGHFSPAARS